MHWHIFCKVIDNHGDLGVCWRLARQLAAGGDTVRLWVDDPAALRWMAPGGMEGVSVIHWQSGDAAREAAVGDPPDVLIEAFGCEPAPELVARCAQRASAGGPKCMWINLEYLSAEPQVERLHGLPSPVSQGPGAGLAKHFFYPGFTAATGGLLREPDLMQTQARFDRAAWLAAQGIEWRGERLVALFCYEPPALAALLARLQAAPEPTHLLVAAGRPTEAVKAIFSKEKGLKPILDLRSQLSISYLPLMPQTEFDRLLWACELNFVRGEDSLVRALWAGAPFIWQLYPQSDNAHHAKLEAFLDWLAAPPSMRLFHRVWNGVEGAALPALANADLAEWRASVQAARERLLAQDDLVTRLARFVRFVRQKS